MYLTSLANFRILLRLMKSNDCVPLLNTLHQNLLYIHIYVNELILALYTPLILTSFNLQIFQRLHPTMAFSPQNLIFVDHFTIFNSSPMHYLRWSSLCQNLPYGWRLDCCYKELHLKGDRATIFDFEVDR